jgi:cell division initiation protein
MIGLMELTPLDVRYQEFKRAFQGYAREEVREYLGKVADRMSALIEENERLRSEIQALQEELNRAREGEAELKRAVVAAERIAREIRNQAERDAELLRKETELARQAALQEVVDQMKRLRGEIEQLKGERDLFISQFQALLESYLHSLERYRR